MMSVPEPEERGEVRPDDRPAHKSDPLTDLALTLPIFVLYHLGVAFLPIRNAADPVTAELRALAKHSLLLYAGLTLTAGATFVVVLWLLGRGHAFQTKRFALTAVEGAAYAVLMRFAGSYVVGSLRLGPPVASDGPFAGFVMSLGAGLYEEVVFRAGLFGLGALGIKFLFGKGVQGLILLSSWALIAAAIFSGWHYIGPMGDPWDVKSFVFRTVCGLVLTGIYVFRGFAAAVYTHALYDVWVLVLR
jgi:hypothetical protein